MHTRLLDEIEHPEQSFGQELQTPFVFVSHDDDRYDPAKQRLMEQAVQVAVDDAVALKFVPLVQAAHVVAEDLYPASHLHVDSHTALGVHVSVLAVQLTPRPLSAACWEFPTGSSPAVS